LTPSFFFTIGAFFLYIFFQLVENLRIIFSAEYEAISEFMGNFAGILCIVYLIDLCNALCDWNEYSRQGNSYTILIWFRTENTEMKVIRTQFFSAFRGW